MDNNNRSKLDDSTKNGNFKNGHANGYKKNNHTNNRSEDKHVKEYTPGRIVGVHAYTSNGDMLIQFNPGKNAPKPIFELRTMPPAMHEELNAIDWIEVEFKSNRKNIYQNVDKVDFNFFDYAVVEAENGFDVGNVINFGENALKKAKSCYANKPKNFKVIRRGTEEDTLQYDKNRAEEEEIVAKTKELVEKYKLEMKVTEAEWQLDRHRLTIFFTAPQRIDFRELVKELARAFRTRIELRQISTREEAKRIGGGVGCCGLNCCCTSFLHDFSHVTLDHARTQQLSNNVSKLSGNCGRLKCCLLFEHDHYVDAFKKYPPHNSVIMSEEGELRIVKVDIFKNTITVFSNKDRKYKSIDYEQLEAYIIDGKIFQPIEPFRHAYDSFADSEEELRALEKDT